MGILTVVCYEQARLFEYFSAPVSQAGCSFVKALYCISFLCQSPLPVAVPCQTMTPGFLRVAWRRACHEPRGLTASHGATLETPLCPPVCLLSSHSESHFSSPPFNSFFFFFFFFFFLLSCPSLLFHLPPSPPPSVFYLPPPDCPSPPCVHTSFPLCIPSSLLPLSHCPGQKRVCQAFPERATGPDHTLRRGFLKLLSVTRGRERIQVELLYTLPCTVVFPNICNTALLNLPSVG